MPPVLRIFVSSPGDVAHERKIARAALDRLKAEFASRAILDPFFWEYEPLEFSKSFQANLPSTADFDIVLCFLWSRLGSPLHSSLKLPDGSLANSGTEFEIEHALAGQRARDGLPDLHVWINRTTPAIPPEPPAVHDERIAQLRALRHFLEERTRDASEGTFIGSYTSYRTLAEFEELLEIKLRKTVERRIGAAVASVDSAEKPRRTWTAGSPYRGLEVFDFEHAPVFFGRTKAVGEAIQLIRLNLADGDDPRGFLLVLGASGSGKSSLVRAGILPTLVEPGVIDGVGLWRRAVMKPSAALGNVAQAFARALLADAALPELRDGNDAVTALAQRIATNPDALVETIVGALRQAAVVQQLVERQRMAEAIRRFEDEGRNEDVDALRARSDGLEPTHARLALLVDQFEELFTGSATGEQRAEFVAALAVLARSGRIVVLATLRSDFFARLAEFPVLLELARNTGTLHLASPGPHEIGQMIRLPAQAAGVIFEDHPHKGRLDELIRDAAVAQAGALPLLEYALDELYRSGADDGVLAHSEYEQLGGVEGAVARCAEAAFAALSLSAQEAFDSAMRALITLGEGDDDVPARKIMCLDESSATSGLVELIDAFAIARLLTRDKDAQGRRIVTVAHEALLRVWPRVASWVRANRDFLRTRARLGRAIALWQENAKHDDYLLARGRPLAEATDLVAEHRTALSAAELAFVAASQTRVDAENRRRTRVRRMAFAAMSVLTFGAIASAVVAVSQSNAARATRDQARRDASDADFRYAARVADQGDVAGAMAYAARSVRNDPANGAAIALSCDLLVQMTNRPLVVKHSDLVSFAEFSRDGTKIVTASRDGTARTWDVRTGEPISDPLRHEDAVWLAVFSPDGTKVVTASHDGAARIWDARSGQPLTVWLQHTHAVLTAWFDSDGTKVVTASHDGTARIWDANTGLPLGDPLRHAGSVWSAVFGPDGTRVVTASEDNTARIWEGNTGKPLGDSLQHKGPVHCANFCADGTKVVTASDDNTARIWDARTGRPLIGPLVHGREVRFAAFSPDGTKVATASRDGTARIWDALTGQPLSSPLRTMGMLTL